MAGGNRARLLCRQSLRVAQRPALQLLELFSLRQPKRDPQGRHAIDVRSALFTREHGAVNLPSERPTMRDEDSAARAVQCFVLW